jgi:hypothetical protein
MTTNGLYSINTKLLDGIDGGATGISVLRNGKILGGGSVLYHFGSYDCSDGKWKGEVTSREHTPSIDVRPFAGHIASMEAPGQQPAAGSVVVHQEIDRTPPPIGGGVALASCHQFVGLGLGHPPSSCG